MELNIFKVTSIPEELTPNSIYILKSTYSNKFELFITSNLIEGQPIEIKSLISSDSITDKWEQDGLPELLRVKPKIGNRVLSHHIELIDDFVKILKDNSITDVEKLADFIDNLDASKIPFNNLETEFESTNVDSAIKEVDSKVNALGNPIQIKGSLNCSTNPNYPQADRISYAWIVTVAGKIGGVNGKSVEKDDLIIASEINLGGTEESVGTSWFIMDANKDKATEDVAGVSKIATELEVLSGQNTEKFITPYTNRNAIKAHTTNMLLDNWQLIGHLYVYNVSVNPLYYKTPINIVTYDSSGKEVDVEKQIVAEGTIKITSILPFEGKLKINFISQ